MIKQLRDFYQKKKILNKSWDVWINRIQQRRNAIHAYKDRDIGTQQELLKDIRTYLEFLKHMNARLPYPDPSNSDF
jgi:predicted metallo-beta-lactamase superfamily hydrolase